MSRKWSALVLIERQVKTKRQNLVRSLGPFFTDLLINSGMFFADLRKDLPRLLILVKANVAEIFIKNNRFCLFVTGNHCISAAQFSLALGTIQAC